MNEAQQPNPDGWSPSIGAVLHGDGSYDALSDDEQAIVRAEWDRRIEARRASLDLEAEFIAKGGTWVVGDEDGNVIYESVDEQGHIVELTREAWERI